MTGKGVDRHLFCLYVVSKYLELDSPFLKVNQIRFDDIRNPSNGPAANFSESFLFPKRQNTYLKPELYLLTSSPEAIPQKFYNAL